MCHVCSCRFNLYFVPYWANVVWLDIVTYLHHHGPSDPDEKIPWYRGEVRVAASYFPLAGQLKRRSSLS